MHNLYVDGKLSYKLYMLLNIFYVKINWQSVKVKFDSFFSLSFCVQHTRTYFINVHVHSQLKNDPVLKTIHFHDAIRNH